MATTASRKAVLAIICGSFIHHIQLASAHAEREAAQTASSFVRKRWESGGEIKHFRDRQLGKKEPVMKSRSWYEMMKLGIRPLCPTYASTAIPYGSAQIFNRLFLRDYCTYWNFPTTTPAVMSVPIESTMLASFFKLFQVFSEFDQRLRRSE